MDLIKAGSLIVPKCILDEYRDIYRYIDTLYNKNWVVYTKKPFSGTKHIIEYLARYSNRVAITNHRIKYLDDGKVCFIYKDYKDRSNKKDTILNEQDFIRRFCLHILPSRFKKVRQYGFVANASKQKAKNIARIALDCRIIILLSRSERKSLAIQRLFGDESDTCHCCKTRKMIIIASEERNKDPPFIANPFTFIKV